MITFISKHKNAFHAGILCIILLAASVIGLLQDSIVKCLAATMSTIVMMLIGCVGGPLGAMILGICSLAIIYYFSFK